MRSRHATADATFASSSAILASFAAHGFATIIESVVLPVLLKPVGRVAIVFITVLLAVLALTNMHTIGVGLSPTEVVPDDSYVIDYFDRYEKSWKGTITMPLVFLV